MDKEEIMHQESLKDHKRIELLVKWILSLTSIAIVAGFTFAFQVHGRLAVLESRADEGPRYTQNDHTLYAQSVDRRITKLESVMEALAPRLERIDTNVQNLLREGRRQ
jgi:hypothetical protein